MTMKVLALNPYHGGSHAQFLDQWKSRSRHEFTVLTLPARHFKWRIRQASVGLSAKARQLTERGERFDLLWTTSMLDAAELRGLLPPSLRSLPLVVYFHENQFEYPVRSKDARDVHFGLINWVSALAADEVWFNSGFNRATFLSGASQLLRKMPDERELQTLRSIEEKSRVQSPGIEPSPFAGKTKRSPGPLHIAWVARWEHDKRPDIFFESLRLLEQAGVPFHVSVLGQHFRTWPEDFETARAQLKQRLVVFGFQESRGDYWNALENCDVVVSTADHEFFGIALLEAVSAGCVPLLPQRLVYPELYPSGCLYDGDALALARRLEGLARLKSTSDWATFRQQFCLEDLVSRHEWSHRANELDDCLENLLDHVKQLHRLDEQ